MLLKEYSKEIDKIKSNKGAMDCTMKTGNMNPADTSKDNVNNDSRGAIKDRVSEKKENRNLRADIEDMREPNIDDDPQWDFEQGQPSGGGNFTWLNEMVIQPIEVAKYTNNRAHSQTYIISKKPEPE